MSLYFQRFSLIIILLSLSACGGGGGTKDVAREVVYADAVAAYEDGDGKLNKAVLTKDNGMYFVKALFEQDIDGEIFSSTAEYSKSELNGLRSQKTLTNMGKKTLSSKINTRYRAASKTETEACIGGGTVAVTENIDKKTNTGTLFLTMNNCVNADGITMNGEMLIDVTAYSDVINETSAYVISFDNVSLSLKGETYTVIGTLSYTETDNYESTVVTNLLQIDAQGKQQLFKNFKEKDIGIYTNVTGQLYLSDYGFIDISTPSPVRVDESVNHFIDLGEMIISGDSSSKIKITGHKNKRGFYDGMRLNMDVDGDGLYELIVVHLYEAEWDDIKDFSINQAPLLTVETFDLNGRGLDNLRVNDYISIDAIAVDPEEGSDIFEVLSLEESPDGSSAQLSHNSSSTGGEGVTFYPDKLGEYKIKVVATDIDGFSSTEEIILKVLGNKAPHAIISNEMGKPLFGRRIDLKAAGSDPEHDSLLNYWEIVSKPVGSNLSLDISGSTDRLRVTPDVEGEYVFSLRVVDPQGASDTTSITIVVPANQNPEAVITISPKAPYILGEYIYIDAFNSIDPEFPYVNLTYKWLLKSKPVNSSVSIHVPVDYRASFVPDVEGEYTIEVTVTDSFGAEGVASTTLVVTK